MIGKEIVIVFCLLSIAMGLHLTEHKKIREEMTDPCCMVLKGQMCGFFGQVCCKQGSCNKLAWGGEYCLEQDVMICPPCEVQCQRQGHKWCNGVCCKTDNDCVDNRCSPLFSVGLPGCQDALLYEKPEQPVVEINSNQTQTQIPAETNQTQDNQTTNEDNQTSQTNETSDNQTTEQNETMSNQTVEQNQTIEENEENLTADQNFTMENNQTIEQNSTIEENYTIEGNQTMEQNLNGTNEAEQDRASEGNETSITAESSSEEDNQPTISENQEKNQTQIQTQRSQATQTPENQTAVTTVDENDNKA